VRYAIDGGAYHGACSREFLRIFPTAEIHAFEPQPDLADQIKRAAASQPRWKLHQAALSDFVGEATFRVPAASYTASLLPPSESFGRCGAYRVKTTTIDSLSLPIEILKLDLQGNELAALRGATATLPHVRAVVCEVNFTPRYQGCSLAHEIAGFLQQFGLRLHRMYDIHSTRSGEWQFADALFVR
jgi:FkbM family methyltransferase